MNFNTRLIQEIEKNLALHSVVFIVNKILQCRNPEMHNKKYFSADSCFFDAGSPNEYIKRGNSILKDLIRRIVKLT